MFDKVCLKCGCSYRGSRNHRRCEKCRAYLYKGRRESKFCVKGGFEKDVELVSYLFGFLFADGSTQMGRGGMVHTVRYLSTDVQVVEDITVRLGYTRPISLNRDYENSGYLPVWENILYSQNAQFWVDRGLRKDKEELTMEGLDVDPWHFLRGHLDGDGSIGVRECSGGEQHLSEVIFLGRERFVTSVKVRMEKEGFVTGKLGERGKLRSLAIGGRMGMEVLNRMYGRATLFLGRKRRVWEGLEPLGSSEGRVRHDRWGVKVGTPFW